MRTIIAYHAVAPGVPCPDGIAAAAVALRRYPGASSVALTYEDWRSPESTPAFSAGDKIVLVDYSVPAAVIESWLEAGIEVEISDHHKTAQADLSRWGKESGVWFQGDECGATLAWKRYFPGKPIPAWLRYVRDRDLWTKQLAHCDAIHLAAGELGRSIQLAEELLELTDRELLDRLLPIGEAVLQKRHDRVAFLIREAVAWEHFPGIPEGSYVPVVRLEEPDDDSLVSDLGNEICSKWLRTPCSQPFAVRMVAHGVSDRSETSMSARSLALTAAAATRMQPGLRMPS